MLNQDVGFANTAEPEMTVQTMQTSSRKLPGLSLFQPVFKVRLQNQKTAWYNGQQSLKQFEVSIYRRTMMKALTLGVFALGFLFLPNSIYAQCGCGSGSYYPAPIAMPPMMGHPLPVPTRHTMHHSPGSVSYVNQLTQPIDRGTYILRYAIHMTDGRILLADGLPPGLTVRGMESQSGGRKMVTSLNGYGAITVTDPESSQVVAVFGNSSH